MTLPFAGRVILFERAFSNCQWLRGRLTDPSPSWWRFWDEISRHRDSDQRIQKPFEVLRDRASVGSDDVKRALAPVARNLNIVMVKSPDLRADYGGMMVTTGFRKS
ncbi:hypothetical protein [Actinoplanes sp. G11-F43]|uniref:hypothetical protein n=1 Tax=Actinoplanes sp. G11-F43 TaxID=3424130 RepID=UPI003D356041